MTRRSLFGLLVGAFTSRRLCFVGVDLSNFPDHLSVLLHGREAIVTEAEYFAMIDESHEHRTPRVFQVLASHGRPAPLVVQWRR